MKRAWLMSVLVAVLLIAGCQQGVEDVRGKIVETEDVGKTGKDSFIGGEVKQKEEVEKQDINLEKTEKDEAKKENEISENAFALGRMQGGIYTNEYVGISCELDSSWEIYTMEELQATSNQIWEGTEHEETVNQLDQITDFSAENVDDMTFFSIVYQKMSMQERVVATMLSEEEFIDALLPSSLSLMDSLSEIEIKK